MAGLHKAPVLGVVLLAAGVGLLVFGLATVGTPWAGASSAAGEEPHVLALALLLAGVLVAGAGFVLLLRRPA